MEYNKNAQLDAAQEESNSKLDYAKRLNEGVLVLTRKQIKEQIALLKAGFTSNGQDLPAAISAQIKSLENSLNLSGGADQSAYDALDHRKTDLLKAIDEESKKATPSVTKLKEELIEVLKAQKLLDPNGKGKATTGGLGGFLSTLGDGNKLKGAAVGLGDASQALGTFATGLADTNAEASYTLDTIAQLAGAASDLALSIISGDPQQIIQASIKAVGTLFSLGKKTREANAAARKEVADFYAAAISGEKEYQALLLQRQIDNAKTNKNAIDGALAEYKLRTQQLAQYKQQSTDIIAQLQGLNSIATETYEHGTWFRKAKVNKTYNSLNGITDFETLSNLLSQGKLEGQAKDLVTQLVDLEQKGVDAQKAIDDLASSTNELFTGTTSDNLTNSLLDMFKSGKTGAEDLASFFKQTMDDAALSIFKNTILQNAMDTFYKEFAEKAKDGTVTAKDRSDLITLFNSLTDDAKKQFELLKDITGSDLTDGTTTPTAKSGAVVGEAITQGTANRMLGITQGTYDEIKRQGLVAQAYFNAAVSNFTTQIKIEQNTFRAANNTDPIPDMAADIKKIAQSGSNSESSLDQLKRNNGIK